MLHSKGETMLEVDSGATSSSEFRALIDHAEIIKPKRTTASRSAMAQMTGRKGSSLHEMRNDSVTDVGIGRAKCYRARKKAQEVENDVKC